MIHLHQGPKWSEAVFLSNQLGAWKSQYVMNAFEALDRRWR